VGVSITMGSGVWVSTGVGVGVSMILTWVGVGEGVTTTWVGWTMGVAVTGGIVGVTGAGVFVGKTVAIGVDESIGTAVRAGGAGVLVAGFGVAGSRPGVPVAAGLVGVAVITADAKGVGVCEGCAPCPTLVVADGAGLPGRSCARGGVSLC
jgi:hypothetical protein